MKNNYNYNDIKEAYEKIGVTKGMTISLKTDLRFLGPYSSNLQMGIGLEATSSKDPYALRRSAIGINRILIENKVSLDLSKIIDNPKVLEFIVQRMKSLLKDYGFSAKDIAICATYKTNDPFNIFKCVEAISKIRSSTDKFDDLVRVYKRVKGSITVDRDYQFDKTKIIESEEQSLYDQILEIQSKYHKLVTQKKYSEAFLLLTNLVDPLEKFFENVRVKVDDEKVSNNRIGLLQILYSLISTTLHF